jgi:hypothetical protein
LYSSRDKVQAHRFTIRRIRSAIIAGDPDVYEVPLARAATAFVVSVGLTILALMAVFVFHRAFPAHAAGPSATVSASATPTSSARATGPASAPPSASPPATASAR